jgi:WD40 repeat protein
MVSSVILFAISLSITNYLAAWQEPVDAIEPYAFLPLKANEGHVNLSFSPDGRALLSACWEGAEIWEVASGQRRGFIQQKHISFIGGADFLGNGRTILITGMTSDSEPALQICSMPEGKFVTALPISRTRSIDCLSSKGGVYVRLYENQRIRVWNVRSGREIRNAKVPSLRRGAALMVGAFSDDEKNLALCADLDHDKNCEKTRFTNEIILHDLETGRFRSIGVLRWDPVFYLAFSSDGKKLIAGGISGTITVIDTASGKRHVIRKRYPQALMSSRDAGVHVMAFSPDGSVVVVGKEGSPRTGIEVWDLRAEKCVSKLSAPKHARILRLAVSKDLRTVAAGFQMRRANYTIGLWKLPEAVRQLSAHSVWQARQVEKETQQGWTSAKPNAKKTERALEKQWRRLASGDAAEAQRAIWWLIERPQAAVFLFGRHLRPVSMPDGKKIKRLISQLDDDEFRVRQKAFEELEALDDRARPELEKAARAQLDPEVRQRTRQLLKWVKEPILSRELLREIRAVEVLEHIQTSEARALLSRLANGWELARLTQEAKAALVRLE